jgi:PEP-CTERM motif
MQATTTLQGNTLNTSIKSMGIAASSRILAPASAACTLALTCLVPTFGHAALPAARAYSFVETKVIVQASDYATDLDTNNNPSPGTSSATSSASRSYSNPGGYSGSGSGNTSASATAAYGTLSGIVGGSGSASGATAQGWANAGAVFTDYLSFGVSGGGPISILFGLGIEGAVNAVQGSAGAGVSGGISVWTPTTSKPLWSGSGSINSATDPTVTASKLVTFQAGDIIQIEAGLSLGGGFAISSGFTGNPPVGIPQSGSFTADASHTAEVFFEILTPGATYVSSSGDLYRSAPSWATPVPEPSTYFLMLAGLAGVMLTARNRARSHVSRFTAGFGLQTSGAEQRT